MKTETCTHLKELLDYEKKVLNLENIPKIERYDLIFNKAVEIRNEYCSKYCKNNIDCELYHHLIRGVGY